MASVMTTAAPILLKLAADLMEQQGLQREAAEARAIAARTEPIYADIIARELARSQQDPQR